MEISGFCLFVTYVRQAIYKLEGPNLPKFLGYVSVPKLQVNFLAGEIDRQISRKRNLNFSPLEIAFGLRSSGPAPKHSGIIWYFHLPHFYYILFPTFNNIFVPEQN